MPNPVTNSKKKLDDIPDYIQKELQCYIAVCAYDVMQNKDLTQQQQHTEIQKHFHGDGDMVGHLWKFMHWKDS